jgi:TonB family protein
MLQVDPDGRVRQIKVVSADQPEFGLALAAAVQAFVFTPALKAGKPIPFVTRFRHTFNRFDLPDSASEAMLTLEKNHPEEIVAANKLDAPPKPTMQPEPQFPTSIGADLITGKAVIECLIDRKGHVRLPRVISATEPAFGYSAVQAANAWWFEPPKQNGHAAVTRVRIPFTFSRESPAPVEPEAKPDGTP